MDNDFLPRRGQNKNTNMPRSQMRAGSWGRPPAFRTPAQTPQNTSQQQLPPAPPAPEMDYDTSMPAPVRRRNLKKWLKGLSRKQLILLITAVVLVLCGLGFAIYQIWIKDDPKPVQHTAKTVTPPPPAPVEPITSTLTGLPITDAAVNQRPVTAVMIENSPDARPQAGLNQAGVVFEAVAEGGITRFLTLFQDTEPDYIGPVRSVRPYYIQWLAGFDAAVAHVGGSGDALAMLRNGVAKDLDQFANPGPYHRVSNRFAPHNMYSSVPALRELQNKKGFTSSYKGFARKKEAKIPTPNATSIDFNISGALFNPHYDYEADTNSYRRYEGGQPHKDEKTGELLNPKVVISIVSAQGRNGIYTTYEPIGSGEAFIFQDGTLTKGTWSKASNKENILFKDGAGAELKLNPGQTWISVVGSADRVTFK